MLVGRACAPTTRPTRRQSNNSTPAPSQMQESHRPQPSLAAPEAPKHKRRPHTPLGRAPAGPAGPPPVECVVLLVKSKRVQVRPLHVPRAVVAHASRQAVLLERVRGAWGERGARARRRAVSNRAASADQPPVAFTPRHAGSQLAIMAATGRVSSSPASQSVGQRSAALWCRYPAATQQLRRRQRPRAARCAAAPSGCSPMMGAAMSWYGRLYCTSRAFAAAMANGCALFSRGGCLATGNACCHARPQAACCAKRWTRLLIATIGAGVLIGNMWVAPPTHAAASA